MSKLRMAQRLILFDIDGTLLVTGGAGREATRLAMMDVFGESGAIDTHSFDGKTDWQTLVELLGVHGYDSSRIGEIMATYQDAMGRRMAEVIGDYAVKACIGALETVQALNQREDVLLGIVTGNVESAAAVKLAAAGFDPAWFVVGAYGHEAHERNDLTPLALTRAQAHVAWSFSEVIVVGDTPADIACARVIDAVAVAVRTGFSEPHALEAAKPDYLLNDLTTFLAEVL